MAGAGTTEQKLLCPERSKVFWNESEMLVHILNHPEQEQCSCELCEEKFDYEGQLFEHLITHMEGKSSIEKDNGSQNYLTNVKDELSLETDNAFKEGKHDEPYFTKADVKDF
ncbi:hypothetical protein JTE90_002923 [Oedothorax gibbosus]|uniref:C2H2-type domain-containing protein n=1 Tax=Oedothorax gibbosus TaxID=931172 RepID=A0AAV6UVP0_9ARAC|nr:hypothetical protein JTE90_002923 [Oedothorax gibbosus]